MFHPLEKELPVKPLHPSEISPFKTPLPLGISTVLCGGGMDIFPNYTIHFVLPNKSNLIYRPNILILTVHVRKQEVCFAQQFLICPTPYPLDKAASDHSPPPGVCIFFFFIILRPLNTISWILGRQLLSELFSKLIFIFVIFFPMFTVNIWFFHTDLNWQSSFFIFGLDGPSEAISKNTGSCFNTERKKVPLEETNFLYSTPKSRNG